MRPDILLETKRLFIRPWQERDTQHFLTMSKDVGYNVFSLPGQYLMRDEAQILERIHEGRDLFNSTGLGKFPLFLKESNQFIGTCGLAPYQLENSPEVELGYRLCLEFWGNGYATEAAQKILEYGLNHLNHPRVIAFVLPQNIQSNKIIEKLGMKYLKVFPHAGLPHKLYEVSRPAFLANT